MLLKKYQRRETNVYSHGTKDISKYGFLFLNTINIPRPDNEEQLLVAGENSSLKSIRKLVEIAAVKV